MKAPRLSIIVPAYQEAARIEASLEQLAVYLRQHHHGEVEVIVVVADSPDGTAKLAATKAPLFKHFRVVAAGPRVGKGRDVRIGMMEATGDYRLFMDADLATPLKYVEAVYAEIDAGAEVIIAVRNLQNSHSFGLRWLVSSFGNRLLRSLLLPGIKDSQCGFKAFSAAATEELFSRQKVLGWGFDMEILAIARLCHYKIAQIPVPDWHDKPDGTLESDVIGAAITTLGELLAIVWRRWTGGYRQKSFIYKPRRQ